MAFPEKQTQTAVKTKYAGRKLTLSHCPRAISRRNLSQRLIDKTTPANMRTGYSRDLFVTKTCDALYEKLCLSLPDEMGKWQQTSIPPTPWELHVTRDSFSAPCLWFAGMLATPVTTAKTVVCSIWLKNNRCGWSTVYWQLSQSCQEAVSVKTEAYISSTEIVYLTFLIQFKASRSQAKKSLRKLYYLISLLERIQSRLSISVIKKKKTHQP